MNIKQTIKMSVTAFVMMLGLSLLVATPSVMADCGEAQTSVINCTADDGSGDIHDSAIWSVLLVVINILTGLVGVAALGGLIYGAILYTSAGSSPDKVKKARSVFTNVVVGIIAYAFMYAFLNFLIPGGIF